MLKWNCSNFLDTHCLHLNPSSSRLSDSTDTPAYRSSSYYQLTYICNCRFRKCLKTSQRKPNNGLTFSLHLLGSSGSPSSHWLLLQPESEVPSVEFSDLGTASWLVYNTSLMHLLYFVFRWCIALTDPKRMLIY